jgi:hypothetical protein
MKRSIEIMPDKPAIIHVNRQFIAMNAKDDGDRPVYTVKWRGETIYAREIDIEGRSKAVYNGTAAIVRRSGVDRGVAGRDTSARRTELYASQSGVNGEPTSTEAVPNLNQPEVSLAYHYGPSGGQFHVCRVIPGRPPKSVAQFDSHAEAWMSATSSTS